MTRLRQKQPRLQLAPKAYQKLCQQVLERDGWRCQACGNSTNLQVHHLQRRSQLGDDNELNLVSLCADCHKAVHRPMRFRTFYRQHSGISQRPRCL